MLPARNDYNSGKSMIYYYIIVTYIALYISDSAGITLTHIGVKQTYPIIISFSFGFVVYFLFLQICKSFLKVTNSETKVKDLNYKIVRDIWPRQKKHKIFSFIAITIFNPIFEETIYRGFLVHYFSVQYNNVLLFLGIGLIVNFINHHYQGFQNYFFHGCFYFISVLLLFSEFGLVGSIGLHFAGDLMPIISFKKSLLEWRKRNTLKYNNSQVTA